MRAASVLIEWTPGCAPKMVSIIDSPPPPKDCSVWLWSEAIVSGFFILLCFVDPLMQSFKVWLAVKESRTIFLGQMDSWCFTMTLQSPHSLQHVSIYCHACIPMLKQKKNSSRTLGRVFWRDCDSVVEDLPAMQNAPGKVQSLASPVRIKL